MDNLPQPPQTRQHLLQYEPQSIQLQNQYKININKNKAENAIGKINAIKMIVQGYIRYVAIAMGKEGECYANTIRMLGSFYGVKSDIGMLIGIMMKHLIGANVYVQSIQKKIRQFIRKQSADDEDSDIEISFQDSASRSQTKASSQLQNVPNPYAKQPDISQFPSDQPSSSIPSINFSQFEQESQPDDIHITFQPQQDPNSDNFANESPQISSYLNKLSKSTTELSYLCQRMKWSQPQFKEQISKINKVLFSCHASVNVKQKDKLFQMTSSCAGAVSKKEAKRIASLFLLRKIYNRMPDAWRKFKQCRQKNPVICMQLNANNQQIFKKAKFDIAETSIFKQPSTIPSPQSSQISLYLSTLQSFKSELNILIGRYKKISPPSFKPQKQDQITSLWPVSVQIYDEGVYLHASARQASKKKAQEICCRDLLHEIFQRDIGRWREFVKYKKEKML